MQIFVNPCPIIQCTVSIIRRNRGHYRYPDESVYPDVLGGVLTEHPTFFNRMPDHSVQRLDGVRRIDHLADVCWVGEERR